MEKELAGLFETPTTSNFPSEICILVVDDDCRCRGIVEKMAGSCNYEVRSFGRAADALEAIKERGARLHLVLTQLHMLAMDELHHGIFKHVGKEFNLPVFLMSANDKEKIVSEILENGPARLYIIKVESAQDSESLWQRVFARKKMKKQRRVWTTELQNKFLEAIEHLGIERAVPNRILEFMNVPGLTRDHVASHLQRHRNHLKEIQEMKESTNFSLPRRNSQFLEQLPNLAPLQPGFHGAISMPSFDSARLLQSEASSSTSRGPTHFPGEPINRKLNIFDDRSNNFLESTEVGASFGHGISNHHLEYSPSSSRSDVGFRIGSDGELPEHSGQLGFSSEAQNADYGISTQYPSTSIWSVSQQQPSVTPTRPLEHERERFKMDKELDFLMDVMGNSIDSVSLLDGDFDDTLLN